MDMWGAWGEGAQLLDQPGIKRKGCVNPTEGINSFRLHSRSGSKYHINSFNTHICWYLVSNMQWMGSPRYCLAAVRADRLVRSKTVSLDWSWPWNKGMRADSLGDMWRWDATDNCYRTKGYLWKSLFLHSQYFSYLPCVNIMLLGSFYPAVDTWESLQNLPQQFTLS